MILKIFIKSILLVSLVFSNFCLSADRGELENKIAELYRYDVTVDLYMDAYKTKLDNMYPNVTIEQLESMYSDAFEYGRKRYIESYIKGLSVYSDVELEELVEFYETEFGQKLIIKNIEANEIVTNDMIDASEDFNQALIEFSNKR